MITRKRLPILLILLVAFALRVVQLTELPPGLTHDEANHGREAIGVLNGVYLFYFPLNYGSEPIYSYTVAGMMRLAGINLFTFRFVNVLASILTIPLTYSFSKRQFGWQTATLSAGLLGVSFWAVASSREALRAGMLPTFMLIGVIGYWQMVNGSRKVTGWLTFVLGIAGTLHIYLSARVGWLIFPIFLALLAGIAPATFRRLWQPTLAGLLAIGLLVTPMFLYLRAHPEALTRLDMLDAPLEALRTFQFAPIWRNVSSGFQGLIRPGYGDQFLAYNIPGKPTLDLLTSLFFLGGIGVCLWRWRMPAFSFLLIWLLVGITPSLITGATANTTRNIVAMPAVYILPAIGFVTLTTKLGKRLPALLATIWLLFVATNSANAYFREWGRSPDVRAAYQQTLVTGLTHLNQQKDGLPPDTTYIISTVYPGAAHDSSIGLVLGQMPAEQTRWIDARLGMILPSSTQHLLMIPASTPPNPIFTPLLQPQNQLTLPESDLDPFIDIYKLAPNPIEGLLPEQSPLTDFNSAVQLENVGRFSELNAGTLFPILTQWRVLDPAKIAPIVPPTFTTDVAFFTHLLAEDGEIMAQWDGLSVPSWGWQHGDRFLQIHPLQLPATLPAGDYRVIVGIYDRDSGVRAVATDGSGMVVGDFVELFSLQVK